MATHYSSLAWENPWTEEPSRLQSPGSPRVRHDLVMKQQWLHLVQYSTCGIHDDDVFVTQSCPTLRTPWTVACQAPLSVEFSRPEYWSGWPFLSPGDCPNPGIEARPPALKAGSLLSETPGKSQNSYQSSTAYCLGKNIYNFYFISSKQELILPFCLYSFCFI